MNATPGSEKEPRRGCLLLRCSAAVRALSCYVQQKTITKHRVVFMKTAGGTVACLLVTSCCIAGKGLSTSTNNAGHEIKPVAFALNVKSKYWYCNNIASSGRRVTHMPLETPGKAAVRSARTRPRRDDGGTVVSSSGGHEKGPLMAQAGQAILSAVGDADDKKAWVLVTPLEDNVVKEVADELRVLNSEGGEQFVGEISTHFAILLRVGDHDFCLLERRAGGVTASSVPPSEVKDRAVGSGASVTSPLEEILGSSAFFGKEAGREFALATNNCRNFAHNFYRAFCRDSSPFFAGDFGATDDVDCFRRWVEPMPRKDGF